MAKEGVNSTLGDILDSIFGFYFCMGYFRFGVLMFN
jgi:hypothetical protein